MIYKLLYGTRETLDTTDGGGMKVFFSLKKKETGSRGKEELNRRKVTKEKPYLTHDLWSIHLTEDLKCPGSDGT